MEDGWRRYDDTKRWYDDASRSREEYVRQNAANVAQLDGHIRRQAQASEFPLIAAESAPAEMPNSRLQSVIVWIVTLTIMVTVLSVMVIGLVTVPGK